LLKPDFVPVAPPKNETASASKITQYYIPAPSYASGLEITIQLLMTKHLEGVLKAIVFLPAARIAKMYHSIGKEMSGVDVFVQHSRQSQSARSRVTEEFKQAKSGILFATDVVARGMHFDGVTHVVQGMICFS
jgi:ATP-dependent RNA helicase MSS116